VDETTMTEFSRGEPCEFSCTYFCSRFNIKNPHIPLQKCRECHQMQVNRGVLMCNNCSVSYEISQDIPDFRKPQLSSKNTDKNYLTEATAKTYSLLWKKIDKRNETPRYHYNKMQEVLPGKIVQGKLGLEVGCGSGLDTHIMAKENPSVEIIAFDVSEGVYAAGYLNRKHENVHIIRASSLNLPLRGDIFDFCYSFGVVHHTPDPERCFSEMNRVLRQNGKASIYVYEDHKDNIWKRRPLQVISMVRKITSRMNKRLVYALSVIASPIIFMFFTIPAWLMGLFPKTRKLTTHIPFNFGKSPFSLQGDIFDRFGAPVELRFNRKQLDGMLKKTGFKDTQFTRLETSAGIVAWASKR